VYIVSLTITYSLNFIAFLCDFKCELKVFVFFFLFNLCVFRVFCFRPFSFNFLAQYISAVGFFKQTNGQSFILKKYYKHHKLKYSLKAWEFLFLEKEYICNKTKRPNLNSAVTRKHEQEFRIFNKTK